MLSPDTDQGVVILVGAGPGDPGLITVRGKDELERADVVIYDHLVAHELLDHLPSHAERIYVGKKAGKHTLPQEEINDLLVKKAQEGNRVVRLKGGDGFVFGRGGEECMHLRQQGVAFEVVPGVSATMAVPAYAGIPVTTRDKATSFIAVTGHEHISKERPHVDWEAVAKIDGTIIIFMGVLAFHKIASLLIRYGRSPDTPAAVIRWGTTKKQETLMGTLETLPKKIAETNIRPPGLIVVGDVVNLRNELQWFQESMVVHQGSIK